MKSESFEPVARPDARLLILGSLPGAMSLAHQRYYAQPRNAFWRIMGEIAGASPDLPYPLRLQRLIESRIALWDVCAEAVRPGSLDTSILLASVVPNDFESFLGTHRGIRLICFNGSTAARLFERLVLPRLPPPLATLPRQLLPSTSPAHAGMPFEQKLARWRSAVRPLLA